MAKGEVRGQNEIKREFKKEVIDKQKILTRLRRLQGQIKAIARMIEHDEDCEVILTQFAAKAAFQSIGIEVLSRAMVDCLDKIVKKAENEEDLLEALAMFKQYVKHLQ